MRTPRYYGAPGVYPEITPTPGVQDVATGIPVFLGLAAQGPLDMPTAVRAQAEFELRFGGALSDAYLYYAIRGFFANGGRECYVVRLKDNALQTLEHSLVKLKDLEEPDLICAPDIVTNPDEALLMQEAVRDHCDALGERFAILDSLPGANTALADSLKEIALQRQALQLPRTNAALYYPWIRVQRATGAGEEYLLVPPSGSIAGVYARTDRTDGVHKAPANEVLDNVVDLAVGLSNGDQARLHPEAQNTGGVNCLRAFPGRGVRIWGARSLSTEPVWRYVNITRLMIAVSRWLQRNMSGVVFEPHTPRVWARIRRSVGGYLGELFAQGAFKGTTPEEAFYVKCDADVNPETVRELGWVIAEIGLAPTAPSEFIIVRIAYTDTGTTLSAPQAKVTAARPPELRVPQPEAAGMRISYIEYSVPGRDVEGEYVLLHNRGTAEIDLGNWLLKDRAGHYFRFPEVMLNPRASVRIWTKAGENTSTDLYWGRKTAVWNNPGDVATLQDRHGRVVDTYRYVG